MTQEKLPARCMACRHCDWPTFATGNAAVIEITAACFHPDVAGAFSPVTGTGAGKPCIATRTSGPCGPDGKLYEPKEGHRQ